MKKQTIQQTKPLQKPRISFPAKHTPLTSLAKDKQQKVNDKPKSNQTNDHLTTQPIKIVFLGDGNCGKTSALISYTTDNFNPDYTPTVFDTYESVVKKGEHVVKLELWDTAGQDEYRKLRSLSYPKTDVFLICFSMVEKKSFTNAITKWYYEVKDNCPRAEVIFVGTKIDLIADRIAAKNVACLLDKDKVEKKISSMGHKLVLCSALTQKGLNAVFDCAIDQMIKKRQAQSDIFKKASQMDCQII